MTRRTAWMLATAAGLVVLLGTLATLQYRWLGDVSAAERERLRTGLRARATDLSADIDREIWRLFAAFRVDANRFDRDDAGTLVDAYERASADASPPGLVKAVFVVGISAETRWDVRKLDVERRALVPTDPGVLGFLHDAGQPAVDGALATKPLLLADTFDAARSVLIVGVPRLAHAQQRGRAGIVPDLSALFRLVVVLLDRDVLIGQVVAPLTAKYFGDGDELVTIASRGTSPTVVYSSSGDVHFRPAAPADVAVPVFTLRPDAAQPPGSADATATTARDHVSITIVRRSEGPAGARVLRSAVDDAAWQLMVQGREASLDVLVARSRRRNLAISLGILALLAGSIVLVIASAQRQHTLATQQMEFVAAVSHELRTPLAVICSAGENLADGVVADTSQVKRYGSLIETEGRRLGDMVERVLQFAGINSRATARTPVKVDVAVVVAGAIASLDGDARECGVEIALHENGPVPSVAGDADALRSAVQNVVGNAVKYSPRGGVVDVETVATDRRVRIRVADRGLGIDASDLPHIFKPFFRGRRAVDAQVRGTGVGLSVVRHVVDEHRGAVDVRSRVGEGTTVTIDLPASSPSLSGAGTES